MMKQVTSMILKTITIAILYLLIFNGTYANAAESNSEIESTITSLGGDNNLTDQTETITFYSKEPLPDRSDDYVIITRNTNNTFAVVLDSGNRSVVTITPVYYYYQSGKVHLYSMTVSATKPGLLWGVSYTQPSIINTDGSFSKGEAIVTFSHGGTLYSFTCTTNLYYNDPVAYLSVTPYDY